MYAHTIKSREPKTVDLYGGCTCGALRYKLSLKSKDDARTIVYVHQQSTRVASRLSLLNTFCRCHHTSSKRASGGAFGLKTRVPSTMFKVEKGQPKEFALEGVVREFCGDCGDAVAERTMVSNRRDIMKSH